MRPKCYERETESLHCNLGGTDRSLQLDRNVTKGNREIATPSRETEIPIGKTDHTNFVRPILVIGFPESWSGKLGGTDLLFSVRPKCYKRETESLHCNLGGTDRSLRFDRNVTKGNKEITIPSQ